MKRPRQKPYTQRGIRRVPCAHCGRPSTAAWSLTPCAAGGLQRWIGLCRDCDLELNARVLDFARVEGREAMIRAYKARVTS
jgi:hypothetical protein